MKKEEYDYLENMRGDRTFTCQNIDVSFHKQEAETKRKDEKRLRTQSTSFEEVSFENDANELVETSFDGDYYEDHDHHNLSATSSTRKKIKFVDISSPKVHVRSSKNSVLSDIYHACAELDGEGFSLRECQIALKVIGNRIFKTEWKMPKEKDRKSKYDENDDDDEDVDEASVIDSDTLPTRSAIRKKLKQMHAYSLGLIAERIAEAKHDGDIVTHATDATTRKHVGTFAPSGLHINRDEYLPLPTLSIASETTHNISQGIQTTFEMLESASKYSSNELYEKVDVHMTDSTSHNVGIAKATGELMNRETPAGQLFCTSHTPLGFDGGIEYIINKIETCMNMDNLFKGFLLDVSIDKKVRHFR